MRILINFQPTSQKFPIKFKAAYRQLPIKFRSVDKQIPITFHSFQRVSVFEHVEHYDGDYFVTPRVDEQTLETDSKLMLDDLTVKAIPYYDTTNAAGGSTVYIANTLS